jgi:hypothetical protein
MKNKKTKSLGKSNDRDVPHDEMALAKLLQTANRLGLRSMRWAMYDTIGYKPKITTACCALGASALGASALEFQDVSVGNDCRDELDTSGPHTSLSGFTIGAAFEQALRPGGA